MWSREELREIPYRDKFFDLPTHKITAVPDEAKILQLHNFVVYGNPLPRDYGQINGHSQRTSEPLKLALVTKDYDWITAIANYADSDLFFQQPFGLEELIRRPRTEGKRNFRVHYARFLLPIVTNYRNEHYYDKYHSPCFTAYYIGTGADRRFISEFILDAAYRADPVSWNSGGKRAHTIPTDWLSNRIDENREKYTLFA
jgi:hypothetical protein